MTTRSKRASCDLLISLPPNKRKNTNINDDIIVRLHVKKPSGGLDSSLVSFNKTISFPNKDQEFVHVNLANNLIESNADLSTLFVIGSDFSDASELRRMELYTNFMMEVERILQCNSNIFVSHNDWVNFFNGIFTHILTNKLKDCSSYYQGSEEVVGFRSKKIRKSDNAPLISFFNEQKTSAEQDVKEIMKILNMVLKDSTKYGFFSAASSAEMINDDFSCFEDYSKLYKASTAFKEFDTFVKNTLAYSDPGTNMLVNLNQLMGATQPEAVLMILHNKIDSNNLAVLTAMVRTCFNTHQPLALI
jgi:precorrin-3B methylase